MRKATAGNKGLIKEAATSVVDLCFLLVNIHFVDNEALSIASFINPRNVTLGFILLFKSAATYADGLRLWREQDLNLYVLSTV